MKKVKAKMDNYTIDTVVLRSDRFYLRLFEFLGKPKTKKNYMQSAYTTAKLYTNNSTVSLFLNGILIELDTDDDYSILLTLDEAKINIENNLTEILTEKGLKDNINIVASYLCENEYCSDNFNCIIYFFYYDGKISLSYIGTEWNQYNIIKFSHSPRIYPNVVISVSGSCLKIHKDPMPPFNLSTSNYNSKFAREMSFLCSIAGIIDLNTNIRIVGYKQDIDQPIYKNPLPGEPKTIREYITAWGGKIYKDYIKFVKEYD